MAKRMTKKKKWYLILDYDFDQDEKTLYLVEKYGYKDAFKWVVMMCLLAEYEGEIDLNDPIVKGRVIHRLGLTEKTFPGFVEKLVECRLVREDAWRVFNRLRNERSVEDAKIYADSSDATAAATEAARERRKRRAEEKTGDAEGASETDVGDRCRRPMSEGHY